jgi:hypothetical protein
LMANCLRLSLMAIFMRLVLQIQYTGESQTHKMKLTRNTQRRHPQKLNKKCTRLDFHSRKYILRAIKGKAERSEAQAPSPSLKPAVFSWVIICCLWNHNVVGFLLKLCWWRLLWCRYHVFVSYRRSTGMELAQLIKVRIWQQTSNLSLSELSEKTIYWFLRCISSEWASMCSLILIALEKAISLLTFFEVSRILNTLFQS